MGVFWLESYESNGLGNKINANGTAYSTVPNWFSGGARTGSRRGQSAGVVALGAGDQDDLIIAGHAFMVPAASTGVFLLFAFRGDAGATTHVTVYVDRTAPESPATIKVYRGDSATGTLLGTSSVFTEPAAASYWHCEAKVRLHDSSGSVVVRVDEATVLTLSGTDTKNGGAGAVFDSIEVSDAYSDFDDGYLANEQGSTNTDFQGAKRVEALAPNGNGNSSQGVGGDGNSTDNYLLVDDLQTPSGSGTDYVDFSTTGDKDTYTHADSAQPTSNAVAAVFVWAFARKNDAGSRSLIPVARLSGTEADGAALPLVNGSFRTVGDVFETKPGGGAWDVSAVNNAEFGIKAGA